MTKTGLSHIYHNDKDFFVEFFFVFFGGVFMAVGLFVFSDVEHGPNGYLLF